MNKLKSSLINDFYYFVKGDSPKLLIHSGTHGDEFGVIDLVEKFTRKYESLLPDFVFVPLVSPSAVSARTRKNSRGADINRIFFSDSSDPEVQENINIIAGKNFDLMVTFHEDPSLEEYYIYDTGVKNKKSDLIIKHNKKLEKLGFKLLNAIDDPDDPDLGYEFKGGYRKFIYNTIQENPAIYGEDELNADMSSSLRANPTLLERGGRHKSSEADNGMLSVWAMNREIIKTCLVPEIPGNLPINKKEIIVDTFFKDVLINYFKH